MLMYEVAIFLIPLITAPYIARVLGTEGTGVYSYTYSIANYFVILIQLGVTIYGRREIASKTTLEERSKAFWSIFAITSVTFCISAVIYILMAFTVGREYTAALLVQGFLLLAAWLDICWLFFGIEKFVLAVSQNIFLKLVSLILIFTLVKKPEDTFLYITIMAVTSFIGVFIMWIFLPKHICRVKISMSDIKQHIKPLLIMTVPVLSMQLFALTDKLLLGMLVDMDSVGVYSNVFKITHIPLTIISTLGTVLLPRISNMIAHGKDKETFAYVERSLSFTMIIGSACAFGLYSIAPTFIPLYLGEEFISGVPITQVLCFVLIPIAFGNAFRTQYIVPRKMDSLYLMTLGIGAGINIILNFILIPLFGAVGAAVASLISEFSITIYLCIRIRKAFSFGRLIMYNLKYVIAAAIMAVAVHFSEMLFPTVTIISVCIQIAIGVAVFSCISLLFEAISKEYVIIDELKKILRRLKRSRS